VSNPRVLVTGANGFLGRWSVPALLARGFEVHALTGPSGRTPAQLAGAMVRSCDLFDARQVATIVQDVGASHLLHFAWIATPGIYWQSPENERWLSASRDLLEQFAAAGGRRIVVAGSCAEYDWSQTEDCDEYSSPLGGARTTPYASSKLALARCLAQLAQARGISGAWGRVFFQYGPDEYPQRLVPSVLCSLLQGREALCSHGRQVRSFLHAADVGGAFAALLQSPAEGAVNIGSDEAISVRDLIARLAAMTTHPELVRLGARPAPDEPARLLPRLGRLQDEVGFRPRFTLEAGLAETVAWWRARLAAGTP
jgi:nucleoside-diphosphate-sugar epimerase